MVICRCNSIVAISISYIINLINNSFKIYPPTDIFSNNIIGKSAERWLRYSARTSDNILVLIVSKYRCKL